MDNAVAAAAIQGASNIGSGLINNIFAKRNLRLQMQASKELMGYEHMYDLDSALIKDQLDVKNWQMQNEYNLPKNQYDRYIAAGLTPAAAAQALSGGVAGSVPAGSVEGVNAPSVASPGLRFDVGNVVGAMLDARRVQNEAKIADAKAFLAEHQAKFLDAQTFTEDVLRDKKLQKYEAEILEKHSEVAKNKAAKENFEAQTARINELTPYEREHLDSETKLCLQKVQESIAQANELKERVKLHQSEEAKNYSESRMFDEYAGESFTRQQGLVYDNINKYYEANRNSITNLLVDNYHINPKDPFYQQIIESAAKGESYGMDFIIALGDYAQGVDKELTKHFPHYKDVLKGVGILRFIEHMGHKNRQRAAEILNNVKTLENIIVPFSGAFSPNSVVDGGYGSYFSNY